MKCISMGVGSYQIIDGDSAILILSKTLVPLDVRIGIYPVINARFNNSASASFDVDNIKISVINLCGYALASIKIV